MSDFTAQGCGGLLLYGCPRYRVDYTYTPTYQAGAIVYIKAKALQGKLKHICVRYTIFHANASSLNYPVFTYIDSTNEIWLEEELTTQDTAIELAQTYFERITEGLINSISTCQK